MKIALACLSIAVFTLCGCSTNSYDDLGGKRLSPYTASASTNEEIKRIADALQIFSQDKDLVSITNIHSLRSDSLDKKTLICANFRLDGEYSKSAVLDEDKLSVDSTLAGARQCNTVEYRHPHSSDYHLSNYDTGFKGALKPPPGAENTKIVERIPDVNFYACSYQYDDLNSPDYSNAWAEHLCKEFGIRKLEEKTERKWVPLEPNSNIQVDSNRSFFPTYIDLPNHRTTDRSRLKTIEELLPKGQPERDRWILDLTRFDIESDPFNRSLKLSPYGTYNGPYYQSSYVSARGEFKNGLLTNPRLELEYFGKDWLFADKVRILADGKIWDFSNLEFYRDNTDKVWETAYLPLSGKALIAAKAIADSDQTTIRFEGYQHYHDFTVTKEMKDDLAAFFRIQSRYR